ncbi:MAG: DsbC family protein [Halorhodospira sp.]
MIPAQASAPSLPVALAYGVAGMVLGGVMLTAAEEAAAERGAQEVAERLAALPEEELVIYEPEEEGEAAHTVTVFTDVNCPYCQSLHEELDAYLEEGIRVRYAAFPLSEGSKETMDRIWCSDDRKEALHRAKIEGKEPEAEPCEASPVASHQEVAEQIGVPGTPTMVTPQGEVSFALAPEDLADLLEEEAAQGR